MLKMTLPLLLILLLLLPGRCAAEKSAVLVVVDGLGSEYIYPGLSPACIDGTLLSGTHLGIVDNASSRLELWVPTPETESGHAVIATGYSGASEETLSYYDATIFDALRSDGYICMGIMETGDSKEMLAELDVVVSERNNSIYAPNCALTVNSGQVPEGVTDILTGNLPGPLKARSDHDVAYRRYDDWPLETALRMVRFMNETHPGQRYLLLVNVAGTDIAAHNEGYESYSRAIAGMDAGLSSLAAACRDAGLVMAVTADHGMSFKSPDSKGTHASGEAALRNESRLTPFLIFSDATCASPVICGQECVAPTLLSLMGCPDTTSVQDGKTLVVGDVSSMSPAGATSARPRSQDWLPYAAVAAISAAGIAIALRVMRR
jgi:2,3-bisphosphoglycerate-independent phosphoglycerate mutase